jgi:hypothetical protein
MINNNILGKSIVNINKMVKASRQGLILPMKVNLKMENIMEMDSLKISCKKEVSKVYFQWDRKNLELNKTKSKYIQEVL